MEYIRVLQRGDDETEGSIRNKGRNAWNFGYVMKNVKSVITTQKREMFEILAEYSTSFCTR